jgi:TolB-like protein/tetratricopeptide (TPR) repeat protein
MADVYATAYDFGPFRLDASTRTLLRHQDVIALPPKAVDVLFALVRQSGEVVPKRVLMDTVWHGSVVEDANLTQMIFLLRRALSADGEGTSYIRTVPRRGYRFVGAVRETAARLSVRIQSLAVLPLVNLSGDPAQDYFTDGITEALIANLARIGELRVVSRTSAMRYKGTTESAANIARALRVDVLVEGSAARIGDRVRITAKLIHGRDDRHVWVETYDEPVAHVLDLQSQIARALATAVQVTLTKDEEFRLTTTRTVNPAAYLHHLKGRYVMRNMTEADQLSAIESFNQAIDIDPEFAAPYAGIAECYTSLAYYFGMVPKDAFARARAAAARAVQLDDDLAEGHAILGLLRLLDEWDWKGADAACSRAAQLAPGDSYVHWKRGMYLQYVGRSDEAIRAHRLAERLDPFSLVAIEQAGWPLYYARRFDEAAAQFRRVIVLGPDSHAGHFGLGWVLVQQGQYEEAVAELRRCAALAGRNSLVECSLAYACGMAGRRDEAAEILHRITDGNPYVPNWYLSLVWIGMRDVDRAFTCLQQALEDREPCLVTIGVDPVFDPIRKDPRFAELERRIAQSQVSGNGDQLSGMVT